MILDEVRARYQALQAQEAAIDALVAPMQADLDALIATMEQARTDAAALAAQIQDARGGADWLKLKTELGILANTIAELSRLEG